MLTHWAILPGDGRMEYLTLFHRLLELISNSVTLMTAPADVFSKDKKLPSRVVATTSVIYHGMVLK
ncbi:hypothetical protein M419DRAFT_123254 [Trichoderma reesei RUT C-30]|jgi:hypothetical protein|uniref:Uncharacterized protein n=1 Tax=Hypocrea jecorina (strain ATCC 56765 / BCRC 32924 / NRRL 11460 / Rut C-30) TaxID=1344414 RepID=A0A024S9R1_HYPJR|nr:hypothetical protein M419DRAFT_123254 [Trichoderma reesei RUT C-30]